MTPMELKYELADVASNLLDVVTDPSMDPDEFPAEAPGLVAKMTGITARAWEGIAQ